MRLDDIKTSACSTNRLENNQIGQKEQKQFF